MTQPRPADDFAAAVLDVVDRIPPGRIMTYGAIADHLGRGGPRGVGGVMARDGEAVAWWRVIRADGTLPSHLMIDAQEHWHLEKTPLTRGVVDVAQALWFPVDERDVVGDRIVEGDCAAVLPTLPDASFQLIYIDPPFNTGKAQRRRTVTTVQDAEGDRTGFAGRRYATTVTARLRYDDVHADYLGMLEPLLHEARRLLTASGTLYLHIDYRQAHAVKLLLDEVFGADAFLNEIIWAYDYGGRARDRWPAKHDTILVYVRTPGGHFFDQDAVERIPYLAPGLVGPEKAARGKLPTDVWWHTIVPTRGPEKTGYPTQKPEGILRRVISASSREGDRVLDFFAGSGTTGAVAHQLGRTFVLVDRNPEAIEVMRTRLPHARVEKA